MPATSSAALARHEAEIERADAGGRRMQHAKAVPALGSSAEQLRRLGRQRQHRLAIGAGKSALPDQHHRLRLAAAAVLTSSASVSVPAPR
jgi:hypothetical protein